MRFLQAILFSLGLHLLLVWSSRFLPVPSVAGKHGERFEFEVVERPQKDAQQFVKQVPIPDQLIAPESEDPLRFLGETRQNVKKQTRAEKTGRTENRAPRPTRPMARKADRPDLFSLSKSTRGEVTTSRKEGATSPHRNELMLPMGVSTVGESLPDEIEIGRFTALNIDRHLYYTFFARVDDLSRAHWTDGLREAIRRTPRSAFLARANDEWISHVDIQLKPNGEFHRAVLLKSSGIDGFDWAAMEAFSRAKIFPNPPRELLEDDGLIHLLYSFTVRYRPKALVQLPQ